MKNFEEILPLLVSIMVAAVLFWGLITGIKKFINMPNTREKINVNSELKRQKQRMNDIRRQQKQLMQNQKQKIRDMRR